MNNRSHLKSTALVPVALALLGAIVLGAGLSTWWAYRNNHLFGNGRWIIGKDTGKFVFYTYDFMFQPLGKTGVDLSHGMGYQEILYHQPEGAGRKLVRLDAKIRLAERGYLSLIFRKQGERRDVVRITNNGRFPSGLYRYDERGHLIETNVFAHSSIDHAQWYRLRFEFADNRWRGYLNDQLFAEYAANAATDGFFGFKGSGLPRATVLVHDIAMTFADPANPQRTWVEREDFRPRYRDIRVLAAALPVSLAVMLLLGWRLRLLLNYLPPEARRRTQIIALSGWLIAWCIPFAFLKKSTGIAFPIALLLGEIFQFATMAIALRGRDGLAFNRRMRIEALLFGAVVMVIVGVSYARLGDSIGRFRHVTTKNLHNVHPDAYVVFPAQNSSSPAYQTSAPVVLRPGEPLICEDHAYRDQRIELTLIPAQNVTVDIAWQQQSFLTRGDPQGEKLPLQRRLIRLTTRSDTPWGVASQTGNRPAPFWPLQGSMRAGETNTLEIKSDADGLRVTLNGETTGFAHLKPLGYGETIVMVHEPSVEVVHLRVEPAGARAVRDRTRFPAGLAVPLAWAGLLWLVLLPAGHRRFFNAFVWSVAAFFPLLFFLVAANALGAGALSFFEFERKAWLDLCLVGFVIAHLNVLVFGKAEIRAKAAYFNLIFVGVIGAAALFVWDVILPEGHVLKVRFNDQTVAPADMALKSGVESAPWYTDNRAIGANTFVWRQQFGHEGISYDKPDGIFRVFVVGGSQAWGSGAASSQQTFAELIEHALVAKGWPVEVFNAGVNGAGISKVMYLTRDLLGAFSPDLIIADVGLNDSASLAQMRGQERHASHAKALAQDFETMVQRVRSFGGTLVLVLEPISSETALRADQLYYGMLKEIAARYGITVVEPASALRAAEADYFIWWDTAHFAPRGHELMAAEIAPAVERALEVRRTEASEE